MAKHQVQYDPVTKILSRNCDIFNPPPGGLGEYIYQCMKKNNNKIAQIHASTGLKETYATLLQKSIRTALKLKEMGAKPGDIISVCSHNHLNTVVPFIAAQFIGAITACTDPTISSEDNEYLMNLVKPKFMFVNEASEDMISEVFDKLGHTCKIITFGNGDKYTNFSTFLEPREDEESFKPIFVEDGNQTAIIFFSSGTTGLPKGICISHNFFPFNIEGTKEWSSEGIILGYASLYWTSSHLIILCAIAFGAARLMCETFNGTEFWKYLEQYEVEITFMAPSQGIQCFKNKPKVLNHKLKRYFMGGAALSSAYLTQIRDALPTVHVSMGYGTTEIGNCSMFDTEDMVLYKHKLESSGRPMPGCNIKIVDPDSEKILGINERGEIRVKSLYMLNGYYKQDSSSCWDEDGYFKTGDIGYYDEDFCLFIVDRIKEMFKYLSWHIVPAKLEAILESHPAVNVAAVVGIPHPEDDNHALGVVILNKGAVATAEEINKYVEEHVDERNRLMAGVRIVESMPYTPSGKIKRRVLRDIFSN